MATKTESVTETSAKPESLMRNSTESRPVQARLIRSTFGRMRAKTAAATGFFLGLISTEAYGVYSAIWGPLSVQKWGSPTDYTLSPGQSISVDNGSCDIGYVNQFGNSLNFSMSGYNGSSDVTKFFNIGLGQTFGSASSLGGEGMCNDPVKVTVLSKAASGAVNIAVQVSQSWPVQEVVGIAAVLALGITVAVAIATALDRRFH